MGDVTEFLRARLDEDEAALADFYVDYAELGHLRSDVEAKRAILAMYEEQPGYDLPEGVSEGRDDNERLADEAAEAALHQVLIHLAATYSDHPDYSAARKP